MINKPSYQILSSSQIFTSEQLSVLRGLDIDTKLQGIEGKRILELACQESGLTRRQVSVCTISTYIFYFSYSFTFNGLFSGP